MARRRKERERFPLVAVLGWPLVAATPLLLIFVRVGNPKVEPMVRLGFGLPALLALLWAFSKVSDARKYRKHVLAVLIVAGAQFLGLFLYFFFTISAGPGGPATQPDTPGNRPSPTRPARRERPITNPAAHGPSTPDATSDAPA